MKKFVSVLLVSITIASVAIAEESENKKFWVGGCFNISGDTDSDGAYAFTEKEKVFNFKIAPEFGYCLSKRVSLGIQIGYNLSNFTRQDGNTGIESTSEEKEKNRSSSLVISPFVRMNVLPIGSIACFFVDGGVQYAHGKLSTISNLSEGYTGSSEYFKEGYNDGRHYNEYSVGLHPGVLINVSKSISLAVKFSFWGYRGSHLCGTERNHSHWAINFDISTLAFGGMFRF